MVPSNLKESPRGHILENHRGRSKEAVIVEGTRRALLVEGRWPHVKGTPKTEDDGDHADDPGRG